MTDMQSLVRLQTWLSPAFPTGAFSYSHGLEAAISARLGVGQGIVWQQWLANLLQRGPGWNDAVLLAESWRKAGDEPALQELSELAEAMSYSRERHLETTAQGNAFVEAAKAWGDLPTLPDLCPLPVAVGAVAGHHAIDLKQALAAYLHAYISNQVQAALRLMKLGQQGGVKLLAELEDSIVETANRAAASTLDELGTNTVLADIAAMQHETMNSRIFRS